MQSHEEDRYEKVVRLWSRCVGFELCLCADRQRTKEQRAALGYCGYGYRHTNNEGAGKDGLSKMIGGGMSQSRWGINVEEDLGGGSKALVTLENRFDADSGLVRRQCAVFPARPMWACRALMVA